MTRKSLRVVPWFNMREWERVYHSLYGGNWRERQWALNRIAVWKSRLHSGLPGAVEATGALVRAEMRREQLACTDPTLSTSAHEDLDPLYTTALAKFVSEIVEPEQVKRQCGMKEASFNLGVPDWIIDLRNASVHSSSRALVNVLHSASELLLQWLRQHYWEEEQHTLEEKDVMDEELSEEPSASRTFVHTLLLRYRDARAQMCSHGKKKGRAFHDDVCSALLQISAVLPDNSEEVVDYLLTPDCLLPEDEVEPSVANEAMAFHSKAPQCKLPTPLKRVWGPLVAILRSDVQYLAEGLVQLKDTEQSTTSQKYLAAAWMLHLLNTTETYTHVLGDNFSLDHMPLRYHLNIPRLLKLAVGNPDCYTPQVVRGLMEHATPSLTQKDQYNLFALLAIQSGSVTDEDRLVSGESEDDDYIYTTDDLLDEMLPNTEPESGGLSGEEEEPESSAVPAAEYNWSLPSYAVDWDDVPLGIVLGSQDDKPNLQLEFKELGSVKSHTDVMDVSKESILTGKDPDPMELEPASDKSCRTQQLLECVHSMMRVFA